MVTLTTNGVRLALLEGQHAEECRIQDHLTPQISAKARELAALWERYEVSLRQRATIEKSMASLLNDRMAA